MFHRAISLDLERGIVRNKCQVRQMLSPIFGLWRLLISTKAMVTEEERLKTKNPTYGVRVYYAACDALGGKAEPAWDWHAGQDASCNAVKEDGMPCQEEHGTVAMPCSWGSEC